MSLRKCGGFIWSYCKLLNPSIQIGIWLLNKKGLDLMFIFWAYFGWNCCECHGVGPRTCKKYIWFQPFESRIVEWYLCWMILFIFITTFNCSFLRNKTLNSIATLLLSLCNPCTSNFIINFRNKMPYEKRYIPHKSIFEYHCISRSSLYKCA